MLFKGGKRGETHGPVVTVDLSEDWVEVWNLTLKPPCSLNLVVSAVAVSLPQ